MSYFLNNKRIKVIRKIEGEKINYYGLALKKEDCEKLEKDYKELTPDEFKTKHYLDQSDVVALGEIEVPPKEFLNILIPNKRVRDINSLSFKDEAKLNSYKCIHHTNQQFKESYMVLHNDGESAWSCLIEYFGNPTHLIIFKDENTFL